VAAAITAFLVITLLYSPRSMENIPMKERIALEVARNHIKLKPLDVETDTKEIFGTLPVIENGHVPVVVNVKGITIHIWVEKGLLFALTSEAELEPIIPPE